MLELQSKLEYDKILEKSEQPVIIDFYRTDCQNCRRIFPKLMDKYKNSSKDWLLAGANIEMVAEVVESLKIKQVPSIMLIHKGKVVDVATDDSKLDELVNTANVLSKRSKVVENAQKS